MTIVSVAFSSPFITVRPVMLGTMRRLGSSRHAAPPLPASTHNRSLILPPAKSPSAPPAQHRNDDNNKETPLKPYTQPTLTLIPRDSFVCETGNAAWCFAVIFGSYKCLQNKCILWCCEIFFSFQITVQPGSCFTTVARLLKLVVCSALVRDGAVNKAEVRCLSVGFDLY